MSSAPLPEGCRPPPLWYSTTRTSSPVTPRHVAPPLSPSKKATQGGDRGSSVCRGGVPTQRLVDGLFPTPPLFAETSVEEPGPLSAADPTEELRPRPSDAKFPPGCDSESRGGTGANSSCSDGCT